MKKLLTVLKWFFIVVLTLIVIALIGLVIFIKTFDANKYKPQIISAANSALGRNLEIGNISLKLSFKSGVALSVADVTISDDPAFSSEKFFKLTSLDVAVDIMQFITKHKVDIKEISIKEPTVILIRDAAGKINAATIGAKKESVPAADNKAETKPAQAKPLPEIVIESFKVEGAKLSFKDNMVNPAAEYVVDKVNIEVKDFTVPAQGITGLNLNVAANVGQITIPQLIVPVTVDTVLNVTDKDLNVNKLTINLAKGVVDIKGKVADYMAAKTFDFDISVKDLEINDVLQQTNASVKVAGVVAVTMKTTGSVNDLNTIKADGDIEVKPATLKGINILRMALDKIPLFSTVATQILSSSDEQLAARLKSEDTSLTRLALKVAFAQRVANIDPISIESQDFTFTSATKVDMTQNYALNGNMILSSQLSTLLGNAAQGFEYLYNDQKQISIPVAIKGKGAEKPVIEVTKMAEALLQNALTNKGAEEINKAVEQYVGKDSGVGEAVTGILNKFLSK